MTVCMFSVCLRVNMFASMKWPDWNSDTPYPMRHKWDQIGWSVRDVDNPPTVAATATGGPAASSGHSYRLNMEFLMKSMPRRLKIMVPFKEVISDINIQISVASPQFSTLFMKYHQIISKTCQYNISSNSPIFHSNTFRAVSTLNYYSKAAF